MKTAHRAPAAVLKCHPDTPSREVDGIETRVGWSDSGALAVTYVLTGDITQLRIPPRGEPCRADRLWERTCFEAFVGLTGKSDYYEFNFSPSGEWATYAFRSYRETASLVDEVPAPEITVRSDENSLVLNAIIRLDHLALIPPRGSFRLAFSAVIEENAGMFSYWALRHPAGKPDFHHSDNFTLQLELTDFKGGQARGLAPTVSPRRENFR